MRISSAFAPVERMRPLSSFSRSTSQRAPVEPGEGAGGAFCLLLLAPSGEKPNCAASKFTASFAVTFFDSITRSMVVREPGLFGLPLVVQVLWWHLVTLLPGTRP